MTDRKSFEMERVIKFVTTLLIGKSTNDYM